MVMPLEDNFEDILGKAQRGLGLSTGEIAARAGVDAGRIEALMRGKLDEEALRKAAPVLGLNAAALVAVARKDYHPVAVELEGLAMFTTPFNDMTVNAFLVWDPATSEAAAFDTGADIGEMLDFVAERKLKVQLILLTHTHGDHVFELDRLISKTGAPAYVSHLEPIEGAKTFEPGLSFDLGSLRIGTRLTSGHSRGGITYFIEGLEKPVAVVGDSLFAGSMGGGMVSYADALRNNREKVLTLPEETIVCPGHGPMTTVGEERVHNPFFS